jgi:error-prone DNA polymerase
VFSQIRGFGEYGFPESHAASFALIAYITAWLRCHHLPAFTAALLNAQPMGFYAPSTIVEDAKHHGVEVRPIDVQHSEWDCTLEAVDDTFAVRMGLRYVKGFGERERAALAEATGPMAWARRLRHALGPVAKALHGGHPLSCLRAELQRRRLPTAEQVLRLPDGKAVDYVGLVICRQRPGTASGVTFYTLEDETGFVNVVVWQRVFEQHAVLAKSALLLGVAGKLQVQEGVVHLVADTLWDPDLRLRTEGTTVRSFH